MVSRSQFALGVMDRLKNVDVKAPATQAMAGYCIASVVVIMANKYVVNSSLDFSLNSTVLLLQAIVSVVTLFGLKTVGLIDFRELNRTDVKNWCPVAIILALMMLTASKSLQYLAVPVYYILKNVSIVLLAVGEVLFFKGKINTVDSVAFVLMIIAAGFIGVASQQALVAKLKATLDKNVSFSFVFSMGYPWMLANWLVTCIFVLAMRNRIQVTKFKDFDAVFYNNILAIPVFLALSITLEGFSIDTIQEQLDEDAIAVMISAGIASITVSYFSDRCVKTVSTTNYAKVGAFTKIFAIVLGAMCFPAPTNFMSISGMVIGSAAIMTHAFAKQLK